MPGTSLAVKPTDTLVVILTGDLLATRERSKETVFKYLNSFSMDTWEKGAIYADWDKIKAGKVSLKRFPFSHRCTGSGAGRLDVGFLQPTVFNRRAEFNSALVVFIWCVLKNQHHFLFLFSAK